jgi:hypothetical protein
VAPPTPWVPDELPAPSPARPIDVLDGGPRDDSASLAGKAAPYFVVLVLLWILRRMFGSSDE